MKLINVLAVGFLLVLSLAAPARAHVVQAGADLRVTQTSGAGEVTLVIAGAQGQETISIGTVVDR